jgi:hypothetical protein
MPLTNPWLAGPAPDRELPRVVLEERILNLLSANNVAVIATVNGDGSPVATPVRYFSLGFEIFYTSWNASVKSRNLRRDARVSAGIVAPARRAGQQPRPPDVRHCPHLRMGRP